MGVYVFNPAFDRMFQAGWVINPFLGTIYEKLDEGPGWDTESIDHSVHSAGHAGTLFEVAFPDVTPTADALGYFGDVRVWGVRVAIRASLREAASRLEAALGIFGVWGSGIPATPVDNSTIYFPGQATEQTLVGPGFLEAVEAFHTPWSLRKNDGTEWTAADLNSTVIQVKGWGNLRVYTVWMDVDLRLRAVTMPGNPYYPNQPIGMYQPISWRFNNAGDGVQKKYQVRVFTAAQYAAGGSGVNTWSKTCTYDSGLTESSKQYHDFTTKKGAKLIRGIADGTWTVAIRTAKDWKGGDWFTPDMVQTFTVGVPGTTTITAPTLNQVYTVSKPTFTATTTIAPADTKGSEWRVYKEPIGGFPDDFDPDITDEVPVWYAEVDGTPATIASVDTEGSLRNANYRLYVRFQEVDFSDWTDWTYQPFSVNVTAQTEPTLAVTLDDPGGRVAYSLNWHADSILYSMQEISLIRKSVDNADTAVRLANYDLDNDLIDAHESIFIPGTIFHSIRRDNNTSLHTTNLDVSGEVRPSDWTTHATIAVASRWETVAGNFRSWLFLLRSDNKLELKWSTNGTAELSQVSTVALPSIPNGEFRHLRARLNVASNYTVTFQYSTDGVTWTTLGSVITGVGATSIFNTGSNRYLEVGSSDSGLGNFGPLYVRQWRLRTAIDSSTNVVQFNGYENLGAIGGGMSLFGANTVPHFRIDGYDYEIPFNKSTTYEAQYRTLYLTNSEYVWSAVEVSSPLTLDKDQTWLVAVDDPSLSRRFLTAEKYQDYETAKIRSASRALGRMLPIVQKAAGRGASFDFGFTVIGEQANEDLEAILESDSKLLLKTPKRMWYVEVSGPYTTRSRIYDSRHGDEDTRIVQVPFIEVGAY